LIKKTWQRIQPDRKVVREFGFILTGFLLIALPMVGNLIRVFVAHEEFHYSLRWPIAAGAALLINLLAPPVMRIIYRAAMVVATGIGWVVLRIILPIFFYLVISPIGFIVRLSGKDLLDQKIDRSAQSYWKKREPKPPKTQYEKLY
jgi:hypothetical protein